MKINIKKVIKFIFCPYVKIRLSDAVGIDGVSRKCYFYLGVLWEFHWFGYWQLWYDGPIHHFSLGILQIYWHETASLKEG